MPDLELWCIFDILIYLLVYYLFLLFVDLNKELQERITELESIEIEIPEPETIIQVIETPPLPVAVEVSSQ